MHIWSMFRTTAEDRDKIGPSEDIRLGDAKDLDAVRVLVRVIQEDTDGARDIARRMSPRDRAVLAFYLRDAGRIVEEEDMLRDTAERRRARETHPDTD